MDGIFKSSSRKLARRDFETGGVLDVKTGGLGWFSRLLLGFVNIEFYCSFFQFHSDQGRVGSPGKEEGRQQCSLPTPRTL